MPAPDDRGTRWLQAQVEHMLAANAVALAPPRFEGDAACYWGTEPGTTTTLYLRLAGDPEPKALHFTPGTLAKCGSGLRSTQHTTLLSIRRTLQNMGVLPT